MIILNTAVYTQNNEKYYFPTQDVWLIQPTLLADLVKSLLTSFAFTIIATEILPL